MKTKVTDRRQNALIKVLFENNRDIDDAAMEMVAQEAGQTGLSTALINAEKISRDDLSKPLVLRCNACDGTWEGLRSLGRSYSTRGSGYMGRIYDLFERVRGSGRCAVTLVIDHAGLSGPETIERIYRSAAECALQLGISLRVIFIINMVPVYNPKKKVPVYTLPHGADNNPLKPRWRTWMWDVSGFRLLKHAEKVRLVSEDTPLLEDSENVERIIKIA